MSPFRAPAQHAAKPLALGPGRPLRKAYRASQSALRAAHPATIDSHDFGCTFRHVIMGHIHQDLDGVHLEYCFTARQDFDQAVFGLLQLLQQAQRDSPDEPRYLHLTIEGHRFPNGDIDLDAHELQSKFLTDFLIDYLTRAILPLCEVNNPRPQKNGIPALSIFKRDNSGH